MLGSMRHRIDVQNPSNVRDELGGSDSSFTTATSVWANIQEKDGKEDFARGKVNTTYTHSMTCRYTPSLNERSRIRYGNRFFNVKSVTNPDGREKFMEVLLSEGSAI